MSDMRLYIGNYSYDGTFKQQKDGTRLLEVRWFTYYGKYYQPKETLNFVITPRSEGDGWLSVSDESIGVMEGGKDLEEALGNAFMDAAIQYEELINDDSPMTESLKVIQDKIKTWAVHAIDSKAQ